MEMKHNPWAVEDITAFLFYNCPECDVKVKDPDAFRGHALQTHERAKGALNAGAFDISYHSESELNNFAEHKDKVKKEDSYVNDYTYESVDSEESETSESNSDDYEYDSTPERKSSPKKRIKREHNSETIEVKPDIYEGSEPTVKKSRPEYHSQCYYCGLVLFAEDRMINHISTNHTPNVSSKMYGEILDYQCVDCLGMFDKPDSLELHVCGVVPFEWLNTQLQKCPDCEAEFEDYGQLLGHHDLEHSKDRNMKCRHPYCHNKKFGTLTDLSDHMKENHKHDCDNCFKNFHTKNALKRHHLRCTEDNLATLDEIECFYCANLFKTNEDLETHKKIKHPKITSYEFKCKYCGFIAPTKWYLKQHKIKDHPTTCTICQKKCDSQSKLNDHMEIVHSTEKSILCDMCDYRCSAIKHLRMHKKRMHEKVKNQFCHVCGKSFFDTNAVKNHIALVHETERRFKCDKCDKAFKTSAMLSRHIRDKHQKFSICTNCDKMFVGTFKLKAHLNNDHQSFNAKEDTKLCPKCDRRFEKTADINEHLHLDHGFEKAFFCAKCNEAFTTQSVLTSHLMEIHDLDPSKESDRAPTIGLPSENIINDKLSKDFKCDICDLYFRSSRTLESHHKQKHQKESHTHFCDQCDWSSFEAARLRKHWQAMHAEKNFRCDKCDYSATTVARLKRHTTAVHDKIYQYACDQCNETFRHKDSLARHCMNEHQILMTWKRTFDKDT